MCCRCWLASKLARALPVLRKVTGAFASCSRNKPVDSRREVLVYVRWYMSQVGLGNFQRSGILPSSCFWMPQYWHQQPRSEYVQFRCGTSGSGVGANILRTAPQQFLDFARLFDSRYSAMMTQCLEPCPRWKLVCKEAGVISMWSHPSHSR